MRALTLLHRGGSRSVAASPTLFSLGSSSPCVLRSYTSRPHCLSSASSASARTDSREVPSRYAWPPRTHHVSDRHSDEQRVGCLLSRIQTDGVSHRRSMVENLARSSVLSLPPALAFPSQRLSSQRLSSPRLSASLSLLSCASPSSSCRSPARPALHAGASMPRSFSVLSSISPEAKQGLDRAAAVAVPLAVSSRSSSVLASLDDQTSSVCGRCPGHSPLPAIFSPDGSLHTLGPRCFPRLLQLLRGHLHLPAPTHAARLSAHAATVPGTSLVGALDSVMFSRPPVGFENFYPQRSAKAVRSQRQAAEADANAKRKEGEKREETPAKRTGLFGQQVEGGEGQQGSQVPPQRQGSRGSEEKPEDAIPDPPPVRLRLYGKAGQGRSDAQRERERLGAEKYRAAHPKPPPPQPQPPPPPPPGSLGAIQREMLKILAWFGLSTFFLYSLLKSRREDMSMQEFLSKYVANGLVDKVEVLGDRGECRAIVYLSPPGASTAAGPMSTEAGPAPIRVASSSVPPEVERGLLAGLTLPPNKAVVRFRTGLSAESFIEKMENFQSSLGIHPRDFLPIYISDQHEFHLFDFLGSLFLFFLIANMVSELIFMRRMRKGGGGGPGGGAGGGLNRLLGNSASRRARVKAETVKVRFSDVAGLHEAKREILEFVTFLKHPQSFRRLGAKLPKGALLVGPPGTGKTLLAKAVAGEAGVPFFSMSGSEFVEIFVGVGASRVRELFDEARKVAPSIIFIDEIDSVGAKRSTSFGNSERDNTLNQLLVEMDGFNPEETVVVLAGTNRDDLLDDALKRPGRFDRLVQIRRPDVAERKEIFKVHLKPLRLAPTIDAVALSERMAALTPGFVGADIANLCNEAAIQAARRRSKVGVEQRDFEAATERTIAGLPSPVKDLLSSHQRRAIAYHECGHAIAGWFLKHGNPVLKLTIIPRSSGALGFAQQMPPTVELHEKDALLDRIAVLLGGRAAEEIFIGAISSGAADDIQKASRLARLSVMQFGMSDRLGLVDYSLQQGGEQNFYRPYSEHTAKVIDDEVSQIINDQYERVKTLLKEREKEVHSLCELLISRESITYSEILECIGPRPVPPDPQMAAYIQALPTRPLLPETGDKETGNKEPGEKETGDNSRRDDDDSGGQERDLDNNDDASVPEKVKEKVREAAEAVAGRKPASGPVACKADKDEDA
ncbi:ATP-dependent metallopeptidase HflB subfamily protein [Toxoplasma gondii TgCatPRC2]|uniref:ATP-dependent metallopeptidase HflB subfamily protein n=2 Tax=Toxoplasma gondii TaxID=5811 RepID=A0A151HAZ7_TOXGO|nr:ATP-dependent metallopeptidase HflB subfamily protein [Toxoplasma gondii ARI]KYK66511.1 ATP-dependent metallopeptidase HflB subfamily protein [Toxoplasma gondii TgCatPRC2]